VARGVEAMRQASRKREAPISRDMVGAVAELLGERVGKPVEAGVNRASAGAPAATEEGNGDGRTEDDSLDSTDQRDRQSDGGVAGEDAGAEGGKSGADDGATEAGDAAGAAALETWDDLARELGVDKAELYKIPVPMGKGETMTLGEFKDRVRSVVDFEKIQADYEERRERESLEMIDARRRVVGIYNKLGATQLPPGFAEALEQDHRQTLARESALLQSARPEWGDPKLSEAARAHIVEALRPYGISAAEVAALDDHRWVLAAQDFAKYKRAQREARDRIRKLEQTGPGAVTAGRSAAAATHTPARGASPGQAAQNAQAQRVSRISRLLGRG
jgi:hypothetical protein